MNIAVVAPTFTAAAYNNAFYDFYVKYFYAHDTPIVCWSCCQLLYGTMPDKSVWPTEFNINPALTLLPVVTALRPNDTVDLLTDLDIHNGQAQYNDVLFLFHHEYLTQQEYDNIQQFVNNGGKLIAMDGNVFFAEVALMEESPVQQVRLVSGHFWKFDGTNIANQMYYTGERWASNTLDWFGSNSDAGPTIAKFGYLNVKFNNNPWGYPAGTSGAENQWMPQSNLSNVNVLLDFKAIYSYPSTYKNVMVYEKNYGSGKILSFSIYTDKVQSNPAFRSFFGSTLNQFLS